VCGGGTYHAAMAEVHRPHLILVDSHAHLDDPKLAAEEGEVLRRAGEAGVAHVVAVGADVASSRRAVEIARRVPQVSATVGVHPHDAATVTEGDWQGLRSLAASGRVVAVGECGLDFFRDLSPRDVQRAVFARHLAMARELGLPVVVHCRDAYEECLSILQSELATPIRGVLHCFQGDAAVARRALDLGLHLGIGGMLTFPREEALRGVVRRLPLGRLLVETDAPYLTPRPKRGRNEPAYVRLVAECLAQVLGVSLGDVAGATAANAQRVFRLPGLSPSGSREGA